MAALNPWLIGGVAVLVLLPLVVLIADVILNIKAGAGAKKAPPVWKGGYPLISHFHKFASNPLATIREGYEATKSNVFTMRFLGYNFTFLVGTKAQLPFFKGEDTELSQNEPYKFMTPIFGRGIVFDAPIETKNQQLTFVSSALKGSALRTYTQKIIKETNQYLDEHWGKAGKIDLLEELSSLIILTASSCLLGDEVRENLFGQVSHLLREIDEGINPIAIINPYLPLPSFRRRDKARAAIADLFVPIIAKRRAIPEDAPKPQDMLQAFIDAEYTDGSKCTDDQIVGMLIGVLFAGQHTSSITSTWVLLQLLHDESFMSRAMQEQVAKVGANTADASTLNMDTVMQLDFMHRCMMEVLRKYPPLIMLMRKNLKPITCGEYTVPPGHYFFAPLAVSMNLPESSPDHIFSNPEKFDPDRFAPPRNEHKPKDADGKDIPFAFCAFGGGRHACLGEQFGYLQVKTIVSILLRRFEFKALGPLPQPDYAAMVVGPLRDNNATMVEYKLRTKPLTEY